MEDHREIVRVYRQIAEDFTRLLERELGQQLVSVVLHGSVARGNARVGSDIDLLVVVEAQRTHFFTWT